MLSFRT